MRPRPRATPKTSQKRQHHHLLPRAFAKVRMWSAWKRFEWTTAMCRSLAWSAAAQTSLSCDWQRRRNTTNHVADFSTAPEKGSWNGNNYQRRIQYNEKLHNLSWDQNESINNSLRLRAAGTRYGHKAVPMQSHTAEQRVQWETSSKSTPFAQYIVPLWVTNLRCQSQTRRAGNIAIKKKRDESRMAPNSTFVCSKHLFALRQSTIPRRRSWQGLVWREMSTTRVVETLLFGPHQTTRWLWWRWDVRINKFCIEWICTSKGNIYDLTQRSCLSMYAKGKSCMMRQTDLKGRPVANFHCRIWSTRLTYEANSGVSRDALAPMNDCKCSKHSVNTSFSSLHSNARCDG